MVSLPSPGIGLRGFLTLSYALVLLACAVRENSMVFGERSPYDCSLHESHRVHELLKTRDKQGRKCHKTVI
ncbi:hypothetical protein E2C01_030539 [Portunus trituberculatus]|uniref:Secreted protein n=1 Tax=Portunus trituberculatus TaxID=210409 RepID=A0A5B7EV40_PORTR|nr:hypothetical protein [Portunus trituberculatus]